MEKQLEPNSVTFDTTFPSGISALFTIRNNDKADIKSLLDTALAFDKALLAVGIKPHVRASGGGFPKKEKEWTGEKCPKDGGRLYHIVTKTNAVGIKPHVRASGGGFPKKEKEWTGEKCPKDGGRFYHIVTKTNKDMCKCEYSTYIGGVAGGCDFVAWGKSIADAQAKQDAWKQTKVTNAGGENVDPKDLPF